MFNFKEALQRYRVAERFGLPFNFCINAFLFGKGTPKENFEKITNNKEEQKINTGYYKLTSVTDLEGKERTEEKYEHFKKYCHSDFEFDYLRGICRWNVLIPRNTKVVSKQTRSYSTETIYECKTNISMIPYQTKSYASECEYTENGFTLCTPNSVYHFEKIKGYKVLGY